ncbi:MAG: type II toxin-antitoxin system death-on-curing family toxin [Candidatus Aminicenantes bacterium]|nr:type II toxin-antitoxin system death-on-curing family toxin [Candidatus Aminicenantes bacterium]
METISVKDIEQTAFYLARELMTFNEPIPDISTRFPNILESCLATPFQSFSKRPLYKGLIAKASILFYLMLKNHPFQNGNKRIAITTMLVFLDLNGKWLNAKLDEFYELSVRVSASQPSEFDDMVASIKGFLKSHMVDT